MIMVDIMRIHCAYSWDVHEYGWSRYTWWCTTEESSVTQPQQGFFSPTNGGETPSMKELINLVRFFSWIIGESSWNPHSKLPWNDGISVYQEEHIHKKFWLKQPLHHHHVDPARWCKSPANVLSSNKLLKTTIEHWWFIVCKGYV